MARGSSLACTDRSDASILSSWAWWLVPPGPPADPLLASTSVISLVLPLGGTVPACSSTVTQLG
eukprot:CAMPEP_0202884002 /NCGR_PEP_ID=MMETSP1391-20130828/40299_1 /ASSEMBLY_ACC=CAM_ASM_000867 /TAXON_ID=1034604 /ORGANISM="Chlamydomonas leiostraca, Strain SAG 11-49" /LENGTH=63 /DNA_ID=CAMNT_0049567103 /DNA_START=28 /DNA_END=216 /DNA_ORIENTATION=+